MNSTSTKSERDPKPGLTAFRFSEMKLKVGDRMQIQPPAALAQNKYTVKLLGYQEGVSIMITPPYAGGLSLPLLEGESVVVRVLSGQYAFGFTSHVVKICKAPFEYLHISYPPSVQGLVIRKAPRIQTKVYANVGNALKNDAEASCVITNLSVTGASVISERPLGQKQDMVGLSFRVAPLGVASSLSIPCVIRAVEEIKGENQIRYGLEFHRIESEQKMVLGSFIYEQLTEGEKLV